MAGARARPAEVPAPLLALPTNLRPGCASDQKHIKTTKDKKITTHKNMNNHGKRAPGGILWGWNLEDLLLNKHLLIVNNFYLF